jgi:signal transduction histidine kinase
MTTIIGNSFGTVTVEDDSPAAIARDVAMVSRLTAVPSILQVICQMTGMGFAAVARVTGGSWTACAVRDEISFGLEPGGQLQIETTLCREVRSARTPIIIEHASQDSVYADHHTPRLYGLESYISVPILLRDGEYFGNLCAIDRRPFPLSAPQIRETFRLFAELIAGQLHDERRYLETDDALASERVTAELREQFIAVLGHDLRSPLGACGAIGEIMKREPDRARVAELGKRLLVSVRRMSSMIDDVLDFARGRMGAGMALTLALEHNLDVLLASVISELQLAGQGPQIQADIRLGGPVLCDPGRVQQVLSNLVKNALVHGSQDMPIGVKVRSDARDLRIEVTNRGTPIAREELERIFEPYARASQATGRRQGLGLGLYICRQIVQAHGGTLRVTSTASEGTRFVATLPVAPVAPAAATPVSPSAGPQAALPGASAPSLSQVKLPTFGD